jgi:4-amino-4-deoxy-L-arabinose transferase-like glycosyltransferase
MGSIGTGLVCAGLSDGVDGSRQQLLRAIPVFATIAMIVGSTVLLFARLGHYALWTDEASTAITAAGVWRTGDTTAWLDDHNLLTYRDGLLLKHQKDRYTSPLQFYLAAPFIGILGRNSLACRLPFALCGLLTVGILLRWLWRWRPPATVWIAAVVILLSSASFFLFQRQCRYYALATVLSSLVAYLYCNWDGSRRRLLLIGIAMSLLLATQYLDYAAVVGCLLIDYGIWGRRKRAIRRSQWLILIAPQLIVAAIVCPIWNPIARAASAVGAETKIEHRVSQIATGIERPSVNPPSSILHLRSSPAPWIAGFLTMLWLNARDLVACDFVILPLLLICPLLYFRNRNSWMLRAPLALLVFLCGIAFFTAHPVAGSGNAEVRYLAPLLPLCIAIGVLSVWGMMSFPGWTRGILILLAGASMVIAPADHGRLALVSSSMDYFRELSTPPGEPYTPVAEWVTANIPQRATVYVTPDWCVSPMMWTASSPTYVWQLSDPPKADYAGLDSVYFKGRIPPEYLVGFGPFVSEIESIRAKFARQGVRYEMVQDVPVYWKEMFRPELIWRSFDAIPAGADERVYVFHRLVSGSEYSHESIRH